MMVTTIVSDVEDRRREGDLAESLARLVLEADPAIAGVGAAERPGPSLNSRMGQDSRPKVLAQPPPVQHPTQHPHQPSHQMPVGPLSSGEGSTDTYFSCHQCV